MGNEEIRPPVVDGDLSVLAAELRVSRSDAAHDEHMLGPGAGVPNSFEIFADSISLGTYSIFFRS
jgi:hypothetical protein